MATRLLKFGPMKIRTCLKGAMLMFMAYFCIELMHISRSVPAENDKDNIEEKDYVIAQGDEKEVEEILGNNAEGINEQLDYVNKVITSQNDVTTDWKEVWNTNRNLFIYSAYLDNRLSGKLTIRLIIMSRNKRRFRGNYFCSLITEDGNSHLLPLTIKEINENWGLEYISSFGLCDIPNDMILQGSSQVAIVLEGHEDYNSGPVINVQKLRDINNDKMDFMSVCVKPLHYEFNRAVWLVEFIELHRLLGVKHFFFYNHTVGPDVDKVLKYYIGEKIVEVFPWSLPVITQKEIRTEGLFASLNDCVLQSVGRFQLTALIDIDEFILPRKHNNYEQLIMDLGFHYTYQFRNVFFYLYWNNDTLTHNALFESANSPGKQLFGSVENSPYLLTQYKTTRLATPHKHNKRSKYFTRPEFTIEAGNHFVWKWTTSKDEKLVDEIVALTHHYRICEFGGFDCLKQEHLIDQTAHKWMLPLVESVAQSCALIFTSQQRCPKAPPLGSPW